MLYFRHQVRRFVILMQGREGSTYVVEALDSHPAVRAAGERLPGLKEQGAHAQLQWVRRFLTPPLLGRSRAIGFKTKLVDVLDPGRFADMLVRMQVSVIWLQRRNLVKQVISWINARRLYEARGDWQLYDERDRLSPPTIGVEEFRRKLEKGEEQRRCTEAFVDGLPLPVLSVFYEDLLVDQQTTFEQTFRFLGVPYRPVQGRTLKVTSDDLRQAIANFGQLRAQYVGTQYESMFDEILPGA
jgi:LPS sulfotransferase NodH